MVPLENWLKFAAGNAGADRSGSRYWFRTAMGLEDLLIREIEECLRPDRVSKSHRNVFVQAVAGSEPAALSVRTADDVYDFLGCCTGIDHKKESASRLQAYFATHLAGDLLRRYPRQRVRLTASFLGKRNYNRFFIENRLGEILKAAGQLSPLSNEEGDTWQPGEVRIRIHLEDDRAYFGASLRDTPLHRRPWRSVRYDGQLHPPVAAGMARELAAFRPEVVIDPFCGSGTLLIESALIRPEATHLGLDWNQQAIEVSREASSKAGTRITFEWKDSLATELPTDQYFLLSNPPWGEKHEITDHFYQSFTPWVKASSGAVLLLPEPLMVNLRRELDRPLEVVTQTRIRGKLAFLVKIDR